MKDTDRWYKVLGLVTFANFILVLFLCFELFSQHSSGEDVLTLLIEKLIIAITMGILGLFICSILFFIRKYSWSFVLGVLLLASLFAFIITLFL